DGEELVADDAIDHGFDVAPRQPIEGENGDVWPSDPRRLEFWPVRNDQQHAKRSCPVYRATERLHACGIGPMRIFQNHQYGFLPRQRLHLGGERFQRFLPALLWLQLERRITPVV